MDRGPDDSALWSEYQSIIARHILPGHDVVDTVNRLLRKSPWLKDSGEHFQISRNGLFITEASWALSRLWRLIHPAQITQDEPTFTAGAVVLLRHGGTDHLMDGRRRINHWQRNGKQGTHRVLILHSEQEGA
jgi:hypothetical protein